MTQDKNPHDSSELVELLAEYATSLQELSKDSKVTAYQALRVLRSRDQIQTALSKSSFISNDDLVRIADLDLQLKQQAQAILQTEQLGQLRQTIDPPESSWWWHLESPLEEAKSEPASGQFDWVWNVGTVTCLVIATSFITQTARAFSTEGFDFLGTLSTISQGAGLAFVAGGALTDKGQKRVSHILSSVKIPPSFHAEATFGASLFLLGSAYTINQNLNVVGDFYYSRAQRHEDRREWSQAFSSYQRALNFSPDDYKIQISIGFLYERLGDFEKAIEEYKKGSGYGIPEFMNAQARAMLMGDLQENDWQGGTDDVVIREVEELLSRASSSNADFTQSLGQSRRDRRLYDDIVVNQVLAELAGIQFQEKLDNEEKETFELVVSRLRSLKRLPNNTQDDESSDLTLASTLGSPRRDCFYWKSFVLEELLDLPDTQGLDYAALITEEQYHCMQFRLDSQLSSTPDALLLRNSELLKRSINEELWDSRLGMKVENYQDFLNLLYKSVLDINSQENSQVFLIQTPEKWLSLANQVSELIEESYIPPQDEMEDVIIWRVFVRGDGKIFAYFAYDEKSREVAEVQPFFIEMVESKAIEDVGEQLENGQIIEFADFKLVISPQDKVLHILPWDLAYTTNAAQCKESCRSIYLNSSVRAAFERYESNLDSQAELNALNAVVNTNGFQFALDTRKGINYDEPGVFKLKVSSDGQVVDYQAMNDVAIDKLDREIPVVGLEIPQFPGLETDSYTYFRFETKGLLARTSYWQEEE